ncbi:MAG: MoaD/ThiS family protein [Verrucomicrobia bacterium]|nr:MoaD/ThiS family protein [Verrucomicrobiota bacterium]
MKLTVDYTGQLASVAGVSEDSVELSGGETLGSVLKNLAESHGEKFSELVFDDEGRIRSTLLAALDGEQATGDKDNLELSGVRELMLMTPIAGG